MRSCIFILGCDVAPRFTAIGAVLNSTLLDEFLSLVLILLSKIASLVDGDIDRRKAMLFAVISIFVASYSKACPQGIKSIGLSAIINISNGGAAFPDGGRLASALFVEPTNERFARGERLNISHLNGVALGKAIIVVPLLVFSENGVIGGSPRRVGIGKIVAYLALLRCIVERHFLLNALLNDYRRRNRLNVGIPLDRNLIV